MLRLGAGLLAAALMSCGVETASAAWVPNYDQSIDPKAPPHSIWLLTNPRAQDCAKMVQMVKAGDLAWEAVYDPKAHCVLLHYVVSD